MLAQTRVTQHNVLYVLLKETFVWVFLFQRMRASVMHYEGMPFFLKLTLSGATVAHLQTYSFFLFFLNK